MANPKKYFSESERKKAKKKWDQTYLGTVEGRKTRLAYYERVKTDPVLKENAKKASRKHYLRNRKRILAQKKEEYLRRELEKLNTK